MVPGFYCPSGPDAKRYVDPNAVVTGNPSTHYYGVMGPGGATDNFTITIGGTVFTYRYGSSGGNGAWSGHGILSHYQDQAGSISTNRYVKMTDITDGTSGTIMLGEISVFMPGTLNQYRSWIRGNSGGSGTCKNVRYPINSTVYNGSNNFNELSFGSQHTGGANFALGDASVRFIRSSITLEIYQGLASMNSGEVANAN